MTTTEPVSYARLAVEYARAASDDPQMALVFLHSMLRAGDGKDQDVWHDCIKWYLKFGKPTWEKIAAWAETVEVEMAIAMAKARASHRSGLARRQTDNPNNNIT